MDCKFPEARDFDVFILFFGCLILTDESTMP